MKCQLCGKPIDQDMYVIKVDDHYGEILEAAHRTCWFGLKKHEQDEQWWKDGGHEGVRA